MGAFDDYYEQLKDELMDDLEEELISRIRDIRDRFQPKQGVEINHSRTWKQVEYDQFVRELTMFIAMISASHNRSPEAMCDRVRLMLKNKHIITVITKKIMEKGGNK